MDLGENGLSDLFDYGSEWVVGNALGDGSTSQKPTNSTEEVKDERTFSQKYKDELKKGVNEDEDDDDLGPGDEDSTETNEDG